MVAFVQKAIGADNTGTLVSSFSAAAASGFGAGNAIVGAFTYFSSVAAQSDISTISDGTVNFNVNSSIIDYLKNSDNTVLATILLTGITAGATTITITYGSGITRGFSRLAFQEISAPGSVDVHGLQSQAATGTLTSPTVTANYNNSYRYGASVNTSTSGDTWTAGSGYTLENANLTTETTSIADEQGALATAGSTAATITSDKTTADHITAIVVIAPQRPWWEPTLAPPVRARSARAAATLAGPILAPQPPGNLIMPPLGGYEFTSPPLLSRERRRVAAMVATGLFRSETRQSDLFNPPLGGYEFTSPPLVVRERTQVAAQVATGLSLSPSQASDLQSPVYGYEPVSPAIVRNRRKPDLPVPLSRADTDAPPQYGHEPVVLPLVRNRRKPDLPVPLSRQDTDVATQYGYELTSAPLLPVRRKPDLPVPLSRLDSDPAPLYGHEQVILPLVRNRRKPDLPVALSRQDADVVTQYGYDLTSSAQLRATRRVDLPVLLNRQDTDVVVPTTAALLNGWDMALYTPPRLTAARLSAALAGMSLTPTQPGDLLATGYGYELFPPPPLLKPHGIIGSAALAGLSLIIPPSGDLLWKPWGWPESWLLRRPPRITDYPAWPASPLISPPPVLLQPGWQLTPPTQFRRRLVILPAFDAGWLLPFVPITPIPPIPTIIITPPNGRWRTVIASGESFLADNNLLSPVVGEVGFALFFDTTIAFSSQISLMTLNFIKPSGDVLTVRYPGFFGGLDANAGDLSMQQGFVRYIFGPGDLDEAGVWSVFLTLGQSRTSGIARFRVLTQIEGLESSMFT